MIHNINLKASPSTEMARNTLYENYFQVYSLSPYYIFPQKLFLYIAYVIMTFPHLTYVNSELIGEYKM